MMALVIEEECLSITLVKHYVTFGSKSSNSMSLAAHLVPDCCNHRDGLLIS